MKNQTTIPNTAEAVKEYLNELTSAELVSIHNEYTQSCNSSDNEIYNNEEEFFNMFFENKAMEAVRAVSYGEYNYSHDYVIFNGYGNLVSFNDPSGEIDIDAISADILENPENYCGIELEEEEEEEEEA